MIATLDPTGLRHRVVEHRTEPRIILQMQGARAGNAKLKPTVFMPSPLLRGEEGRGKREG